MIIFIIVVFVLAKLSGYTDMSWWMVVPVAFMALGVDVSRFAVEEAVHELKRRRK